MVADAVTGNISCEATTLSGNIFAEAMRVAVVCAGTAGVPVTVAEAVTAFASAEGYALAGFCD